MVSIDFVYKSVQLIANKSQNSGYLPPTEFNRYAQIVNLGLLDLKYPKYQIDSKITDELKSFVKRRQLFVNEFGKADYPKDFYYIDSMLVYDRESYMNLRLSCADGTQPTLLDYAKLPKITVKEVDNDKFGYLNMTETFRPTYTEPRYRTYSDGFILAPIDIGVVELSYFKKPTTPVWAYTLDANGLPVYDATNSVDFEWDITCQNELITMICSHFGIEIRDFELTKVTSELQQSGE